MYISRFHSIGQRDKLGYLYGVNGQHIGGDGRHYTPARASLQALYELSDVPGVEGVLLYGSAVKPPWKVAVSRPKYWFFGSLVWSEETREISHVADFDVIVFCGAPPNPEVVPPLIVSDAYASAVHTSGYHVLYLSQRQYRAGQADGDEVCVSSAREGVLIAHRKGCWDLADIIPPRLVAKWEVNNGGLWDCRVEKITSAR